MDLSLCRWRCLYSIIPILFVNISRSTQRNAATTAGFGCPDRFGAYYNIYQHLNFPTLGYSTLFFPLEPLTIFHPTRHAKAACLLNYHKQSIYPLIKSERLVCTLGGPVSLRCSSCSSTFPPLMSPPAVA